MHEREGPYHKVKKKWSILLLAISSSQENKMSVKDSYILLLSLQLYSPESIATDIAGSFNIDIFQMYLLKIK